MAERVKIEWWNRPVTFGLFLVALAVVAIGLLGHVGLSGPSESVAAPVVSPLPAPAPVAVAEKPAPEPEAAVQSGDSGISIRGQSLTKAFCTNDP